MFRAQRSFTGFSHRCALAALSVHRSYVQDENEQIRARRERPPPLDNSHFARSHWIYLPRRGRASGATATVDREPRLKGGTASCVVCGRRRFMMPLSDGMLMLLECCGSAKNMNHEPNGQRSKKIDCLSHRHSIEHVRLSPLSMSHATTLSSLNLRQC